MATKMLVTFTEAGISVKDMEKRHVVEKSRSLEQGINMACSQLPSDPGLVGPETHLGV